MVGREQSIHDIHELTTLDSAAGFRIILTPIDTLKTTLQVQGASGTAILRQRIKTNGIGSLWWGAIATAGHVVGHYPWFATVSPSSPFQIETALIHDSTTSYQKISLRYRSKTNFSSGCSASHSLASSPLSCLTPFPIL